MKCIAYVFALALSLFGCAKKEISIDCLPLELKQNIIAFYPFNDGSLKDESLHGNDLVNLTLATPTYDRDSNINCAYFFNNKVQNVSQLTATESGFLDSLNSFTVAAWYLNIDPVKGFASIKHLVIRGEVKICPELSGDWSLALYDLTRGVFTTSVGVWTNNIPVSGIWHHLVGVKDKNVFRIYLDGIKHEEMEYLGGDHTCIDYKPSTEGGDFYIGKKFNGSIDDVIIFNRALSEDEIWKLYLSEPCCK